MSYYDGAVKSQCLYYRYGNEMYHCGRESGGTGENRYIYTQRTIPTSKMGQWNENTYLYNVKKFQTHYTPPNASNPQVYPPSIILCALLFMIQQSWHPVFSGYFDQGVSWILCFGQCLQ